MKYVNIIFNIAWVFVATVIFAEPIKPDTPKEARARTYIDGNVRHVALSDIEDALIVYFQIDKNLSFDTPKQKLWFGIFTDQVKINNDTNNLCSVLLCKEILVPRYIDKCYSIVYIDLSPFRFESCNYFIIREVEEDHTFNFYRIYRRIDNLSEPISFAIDELETLGYTGI